MNLFYIPNPKQYLNLTTTLLTINKQQIIEKNSTMTKVDIL